MNILELLDTDRDVELYKTQLKFNFTDTDYLGLECGGGESLQKQHKLYIHTNTHTYKQQSHLSLKMQTQMH